MAAKSCCFSSKNEQQNLDSFSTATKPQSDLQYINLNLNQNYHECNKAHLIHSKSISYDGKRIDKSDFDCNGLQNDSHSRNKWYKELFNPFQSEIPKNCSREEQTKEECNSSSTLSLHIAAYENLVEDTKSIDKSEGIKIQDKHAVEKGEFENPRQENDEPMKPEVMQFKASQKLLNPNQQISSSNADNKKNVAESQFENLKVKANTLFNATKYQEAIEIYNEILQLPSLTSENKATIYSNKSATNLMLKDGKSALKNAEESIKLWPNWWRGYYRLGRAQIKLQEWSNAEKSFVKALALNSASKEIRDELGDVRSKIQLHSHPKFIDPSFREFKLCNPGNENSPLNYEQFGKYVEEAAAKGSKTAQRHMNIWKNLNDSMIAFKKNDSAELVTALSKAIRSGYDIVDIPPSFKTLIMERFKAHPNELDTVICYAQMNTKNPAVTKFLSKYTEMFPNDYYLWEAFIAACMTFIQDIDVAIEVARMALALHPHPRFMYFYAVLLHKKFSKNFFLLHQDLSLECIQAFDAYLAVVPDDDEKVPACHYQKAQYYISVYDFSNAFASIKAGEIAEKKQLPCFLPYNSQAYYQMNPMMKYFYELYKDESPENLYNRL